MKKLVTREARIILGAAVIDDVLGLLILAVVAGAIKATGTGAALSVFEIILIAAKAILFLVGALAFGHFIVPHLLRGAGRFESRGVLLTLSISFCLLLAWAAARVGLAPIVGAFAAGLTLDEAHFHGARGQEEFKLGQLLTPVNAIFVPIFFVLMGLKVDLRVFARPELLGFALALTLAAIAGKQVCSLAVAERRINRLAVGLGMIPRGEVGLIFASIGMTLLLPGAGGGSASSTGTTAVDSSSAVAVGACRTTARPATSAADASSFFVRGMVLSHRDARPRPRERGRRRGEREQEEQERHPAQEAPPR
jgi:Kef-type K+ transport system membrane component KefB